jgi:dTDP-glucose pyrophosphorylase
MIIVFPMTGQLFFDDKEYLYPKPLIEMGGKTMLETAIQTYSEIEDVSFKFIVREEDERHLKLGAVIQQATKGFDVDVIKVPDRTAGSLCSAMLALSGIEKKSEVIVSNYDQVLDADINNHLDFYRASKADFGLISFDSIHPKWSYVRMNNKGDVCEAAEKRPISRHALCGIYYFACAEDFVNSAYQVLLSASPSQGNFFISESINQLILNGKKGVVKGIERNKYFNFYDSHTLSDYLSKEARPENWLHRSTQSYVRAFNRGDIKKILGFFSEYATLVDPGNNLNGKSELEIFLIDFFEINQDVIFSANKILVDEDTSIIHFSLSLQNKVFKGVDVITWEDGLIKSLEAYLSEVYQ